MSGKNLILKLHSQLDSQVWFANVKMLSTNQIAGFLNLISQKLLSYKVNFLSVCTHLSKVHTDDVVLGGHPPKRLLKL